MRIRLVGEPMASRGARAVLLYWLNLYNTSQIHKAGGRTRGIRVVGGELAAPRSSL